jgi:hypothetical protein
MEVRCQIVKIGGWRSLGIMKYVNLGYFIIIRAGINLCLVVVMNESTNGILDSIS